ncbi:aspartate 4-decarboxylase [Alkalibacterium subtropicum]|uniref:Aminotransferase n=1 Tax=Alkalibacterium subtropicum TaxID=753702 RepID=A0A1I1F9Z0_9LACT|nr:aspartate 4-decarboxylase [Alkalibacterium subtropicum]SFB96104.1 aspartate 4-decarboxylase [Alkalibacterium subtropicum]
MKQNLESLSPFELNLYLESRMTHQESNKEWLNAGRGNPNWTAPIPREAYFLLGEFATKETMRKEKESIGTMIKEKTGQTERFEAFVNQKESPGAELLQDIWENGSHLLGLPREQWLTQMLDYSIGDNYPYPERVLTACEQPIKQYLHHELFKAETEPFDIFAVEGGTAGIVYTFKSLVNNHLLERHDKIALMIPTFAPYMEIPELPEYGFDVEYIRSELMEIDGQRSYQFSERELDRLRNNEIKAVFVVNPSNPTANAIYDDSIDQLKDIVKRDNPDLMILSDDVYGTFLKDFTSLFTAIPYNTACIYSYSKYFGATGWRVGTIALAKDNIFDKRLRELPEAKKEALDERYGTLTSEPRDISFIDRLVADSRSVALNHAAGLSAPQQVMMTLFSLYALLDKEDEYKQAVMDICQTRGELLYESLEMSIPYKSLNTAYYCEIDFDWWLEKRYGRAFKSFVQETWTMTDIVARLAEEEQLMLLKAEAFGSSKWTVRVSLANLETKAYKEIGVRVSAMMDRLHSNWKNSRK